jgi:hypothetical protein
MAAVESLKQLFRHRVPAQVLIARELKARMLVFPVILRVDMPYFYIFLLSGVLPWTCFASTLTESGTSTLTNGG